MYDNYDSFITQPIQKEITRDVKIKNRFFDITKIFNHTPDNQISHLFIDSTWIKKKMIFYVGGAHKLEGSKVLIKPIAFFIVDSQDDAPVKSGFDLVN